MVLRPRGRCPLCTHAEHSPHMPFGEISVVRCRSCGFLFSDAIMDERTMADFYAGSYGGLRHRQGQQVNALVNLRAVRRLVQLAPGSRVLEVGSGYGCLLRLMKDRWGIVPVGVELSREEAEYSRRENGVETLEVALEECGLPLRSFDLVACFETIEHVPAPLAFMRTMRRYLKPGGRLLVMTDNFASAAAVKMGPAFPKWIPHQHVSHFTHDTLPRALAMDDTLRIEGRLSYTPWELAVRSTLMRRSTEARAVFDLQRELDTEMTRGYRMYGVRRRINQLWAGCTFRSNLRGALMYVMARCTDGSTSPVEA